MTRSFFKLALLLGCFFPTVLHAQDKTNLQACYKVDLGSRSPVYDGSTLLEMVRLEAGTSLTAIAPLDNGQKPNAKKCSNPVESALKAANLSAATSRYYGQIQSRSTYRKLAELPCGAAGGVNDMFFMVGDVVLYRNCAPGAGTGYIYFYGLNEGKSSSCFGSTYPEMYSTLIGARPKVDLDQLRAAETKGQVGLVDAGGEALANEVAAELIAETYRDYNLKFINAMLLDIAATEKLKPANILAGYCLKNIPKGSCKNPQAGDGIHPLAWGGAQAVMMVGGWGGAAGANSDFGKNFEAGTIESWLVDVKKAKKVAADATCVHAVDGAYPVNHATGVADHAAFVKLLNDNLSK